MLEEINDGRTDLVFEYVAAGNAASGELLRTCAYYGDVSAMKFLLANGVPLGELGDNLDLNGAAFHGHWRLVLYLLEQGADPNHPYPDTAETPLHVAIKSGPKHAQIVELLLHFGADPNAVTIPHVETGCFMRDCRTKGETPLHRAAAFADVDVIDMLLKAGATKEAKDVHGDTPLSWGSWYARNGKVLRRLCFGNFRISEAYEQPGGGMEAFLRGKPHPRAQRIIP